MPCHLIKLLWFSLNIIHVAYRGYNLWCYEDLRENFSRKPQITATKVTVTPN